MVVMMMMMIVVAGDDGVGIRVVTAGIIASVLNLIMIVAICLVAGQIRLTTNLINTRWDIGQLWQLDLNGKV